MAITISGSGITSANIADGTIVNADVNDVAASKLTGALPAISGASLTNLPGGGKVLQVVQTSTNTEIVDTTEGNNVDLMSVAITPSSTSSKILIMMTWFEGYSNPNGAYRLYRDSTSLGVASGTYGGGSGFLAYDDVVATTHQMESKSFTFLDSPSTTSAITYKLSTDSSSSVYFNRSLQSSSGHSTSTITVMEIGA